MGDSGRGKSTLAKRLSEKLEEIGSDPISPARAEEGSGEESARASAFFFEKIGDYKKRTRIWDYTSILRHGAIVDKVIV